MEWCSGVITMETIFISVLLIILALQVVVHLFVYRNLMKAIENKYLPTYDEAVNMV